MVKNLQFTDITERIKIKTSAKDWVYIQKNGKSYADTYNYNDSPTCKSKMGGIFGRNPCHFRIWTPEEFTQNNGKLPPAPKCVGEVQIQKPFHQGGFKKTCETFPRNLPKKLA